VNSIKKTGYFTGGETSYARLWYVLSDNGYHDLALSLALSTSYPSLGYQFVNDFEVYATTLWEIFDAYAGGKPGVNSLNHVMFSTVGQWYYERLAGIERTTDRDQPLIIHPRFPLQHSLLSHVTAEYRSSHGLVAVDWEIASPLLDSMTEEWSLRMMITLPPNAPPVPVIFHPLSSSGSYENIHDAAYGLVWEATTGSLVPGVLSASASSSSRAESVTLMLTSGHFDFRAKWRDNHSINSDPESSFHQSALLTV
jgi:hypothetical protein